MTGANREAAGLAALAAVARSTQGAEGSAAICARLCESIAHSLGSDRVALMRYDAEDDRVELLGAYGPPNPESTGWPREAAQRLFLQARDSGLPVLVRTTRPATGGSATLRSAAVEAAVVVPLFTRTGCIGYLIVAQVDAPFAFDASRCAPFTTLGTIVAAFLEKAIVHDDLVNSLRLKGEFIALASHELRTPAAAIFGAVRTLRGRDHTLRPEQKRHLVRLLDEQADRLHGLVEQLLDLSRLEARSVRIKPIALAVRERTEEIVRAVVAERGGGIAIRVDPLLRVSADPEAFERIVSNLIVNAFRYGRPPITVSAAVNDRHFRLAVEDRGQGVSREFAPRLFERFSRAGGSAEPGAGLGLSIAQAYAHAHGGQLAYMDAEPHGARFELIVPIHSPVVDQPGLQSAGASILQPGQAVRLNGRAASFCYAVESGGAVIRYEGEQGARVVPLGKLVPASPPAE